MIAANFSRTQTSWVYWTTITSRYGARSIGIETIGFMDDFGDFVMSKSPMRQTA